MRLGLTNITSGQLPRSRMFVLNTLEFYDLSLSIDRKLTQNQVRSNANFT
ncbi:hypothetical protein [Microcoleus sp. S13_C5]